MKKQSQIKTSGHGHLSSILSIALIFVISGIFSTSYAAKTKRPCTGSLVGKAKKRQRVKWGNTPGDRLLREKLLEARTKASKVDDSDKRDDSRRGLAPIAPARDYLNELNNLAEFNILSTNKSIGSDTLKVSKVVFHVRPRVGSSKLYFINTNRFHFHYDFVTRALKHQFSIMQFNSNYEGEGAGREFNLATLVYSPRNKGTDNKEYLLQVDETDYLAGQHMKRLFDEVQSRLPEGATLVLHPLSMGQLQLAKSQVQSIGIPFVTTSQLFGDRQYFALNRGTSMGYVNVATTEEQQMLLSFMDVAIFDEAPLYLGLTAANGSRMFQTPMSHVNVKSKNRGTPNFSWTKVLDYFGKIEDKPIRITVGDGDQPRVEMLNEATAAKEIADFWKDRRPKLKEDPAFILDHKYKDSFMYTSQYFNGLPNREGIRTLTQMIGAKAANLALVEFINRYGQRLHRVKVPETIGVPFTHYQNFINVKHDANVFLTEGEILDPDQDIDEKIMFKPSQELKSILTVGKQYSLAEVVKERLRRTGLLNDSEMHPMARVAPVLKEIRQLYMKVNLIESQSTIIENFRKAIFEDVNSPIHISKKVSKARLRSSTNSEDLPGFTGAGLYNSTGVKLFKKKKNSDGTKGGSDFTRPRSWKKIKADLIDAIRYDYSGVWNDRAFAEREWFSINGEKHLDIKVGIAVHRAFSGKNQDGGHGEVANFVAVSGNPLNANYDPGSSRVREFYFNSQHYDLAVTNPPYVDELEEYGEDPSKPYRTQSDLIRLLSLTYPSGDMRGFTEWTIKRLTDSSIKIGQDVFVDNAQVKDDLKQMELRRFAAAIELIHVNFARVYGEDVWQYMGDVEGKVYQECDGCERDLWIKQFREFVRPESDDQGDGHPT